MACVNIFNAWVVNVLSDLALVSDRRYLVLVRKDEGRWNMIPRIILQSEVSVGRRVVCHLACPMPRSCRFQVIVE